MIEVSVNKNILDEAKSRNQEFFVKFGNSGTHRENKEQRMTGYLAEACINDRFNDFSYSDHFNVDFLLDDNTIDSKAQGCNSKPLDYYSATLYEEQKKRKTDYYIFSRVKKDFSKVWICGIISKIKFFKIAKLKPKGTKTQNFVYDQSRYEVQYKDLADINVFLKWYKGELNK
jgi:hypothetical protein